MTGTPPAHNERISVFISYAHESREHKERVYGLAAALLRDGFTVLIDIAKDTDEDWPLWMQRQIQQATYVLCVCSREYLERFEQASLPDVGRGVGWEGGLIRRLLYGKKLQNGRVFPVFFQESGEESIPLSLDGYDRFLLDGDPGYALLLRRLLKTPEFKLAEPSDEVRRVQLKTQTVEPLFGTPKLEETPNPMHAARPPVHTRRWAIVCGLAGLLLAVCSLVLFPWPKAPPDQDSADATQLQIVADELAEGIAKAYWGDADHRKPEVLKDAKQRIEGTVYASWKLTVERTSKSAYLNDAEYLAGTITGVVRDVDGTEHPVSFEVQASPSDKTLSLAQYKQRTILIRGGVFKVDTDAEVNTIVMKDCEFQLEPNE